MFCNTLTRAYKITPRSPRVLEVSRTAVPAKGPYLPNRVVRRVRQHSDSRADQRSFPRSVRPHVCDRHLCVESTGRAVEPAGNVGVEVRHVQFIRQVLQITVETPDHEPSFSRTKLFPSQIPLRSLGPLQIVGVQWRLHAIVQGVQTQNDVFPDVQHCIRWVLLHVHTYDLRDHENC